MLENTNFERSISLLLDQVWNLGREKPPNSTRLKVFSASIEIIISGWVGLRCVFFVIRKHQLDYWEVHKQNQNGCLPISAHFQTTVQLGFSTILQRYICNGSLLACFWAGLKPSIFSMGGGRDNQEANQESLKEALMAEATSVNH